MATLRNKWQDFDELLNRLISSVECDAVNGDPPDCQGLINELNAARDEVLKHVADTLDVIVED